MSSPKTNVKEIIRNGLIFFIKFLPKKEAVVVHGFPNVESGAVSVANYIQANYKMQVFFKVSPVLADNPRKVLHKDIKILPISGNLKIQLDYIYRLYTSKYFFSTHDLLIESFAKKQTTVNLWHGILYKKIGTLVGAKPIIADISVGTSPLTKAMFAEAFGVSEKSVFISGYPRNDVMLQAKLEKNKIIKNLISDFKQYNKLIIWLPTYRQKNNSTKRIDGTEVGNPFYIPDFQVIKFNKILKDNNSFCFIKPHPKAVRYRDDANYSNMIFIDDKWISDHCMSLYQLVGITDILISDVSSIVIDYLLLDQPIICVSSDFDAYKKSRGFYFEDIENWLPNLFKTQVDFFEYLTLLFSGEEDPYTKKRVDLKNRFFTYYDAKSTERLVKHVFGD